MKKICSWSGPRNVSTAFMYSFAQREDTIVVDEPLYGHYLRISGAKHPGHHEIMQKINCDGNEVMEILMAQKSPHHKILFLKQMSHHLQRINRDFLLETDNIFLIRDPKEVLPSLTKQLPNASIGDTGLDLQWQLFQELCSAGKSPVVIDSKELLINPKNILIQLCEHLSIPFFKEMLSWEPGPIKEDGMWAKYWYQEVHRSNGFIPYKPKPDLSVELLSLFNECRPYYDNLFEHALTTTHNK
ncbi:MAG: sulfotransferase family protein [Pseudomonadota bacterium]|nr:sulfotransferase family protein [Pseudomonadota bacterium]